MAIISFSVMRGSGGGEESPVRAEQEPISSLRKRACDKPYALAPETWLVLTFSITEFVMPPLIIYGLSYNFLSYQRRDV